MKKKSSDTSSEDLNFGNLKESYMRNSDNLLTIGIIDNRDPRDKNYVDYMSDSISIASVRSNYGNALETLIPFAREHFKDKCVYFS